MPTKNSTSTTSSLSSTSSTSNNNTADSEIAEVRLRRLSLHHLTVSEEQIRNRRDLYRRSIHFQDEDRKRFNRRSIDELGLKSKFD